MFLRMLHSSIVEGAEGAEPVDFIHKIAIIKMSARFNADFDQNGDKHENLCIKPTPIM